MHRSAVFNLASPRADADQFHRPPSERARLNDKRDGRTSRRSYGGPFADFTSNTAMMRR